MKKILIPLLGTAIFIIAVGLLTKGNLVKDIQNTKTQTNTKTIKVADKLLSVEVADTDSERQKGLGGKLILGQDQGMLFVFDQAQAYHSFWMKDMKFAIDIIWISNNKIVQIDKDAKAEPGVSDQNLKRYISKVPVDLVLEVNSGFCDKNSIKVGDTITP